MTKPRNAREACELFYTVVAVTMHTDDLGKNSLPTHQGAEARRFHLRTVIHDLLYHSRPNLSAAKRERLCLTEILDLDGTTADKIQLRKIRDVLHSRIEEGPFQKEMERLERECLLGVPSLYRSIARRGAMYCFKRISDAASHVRPPNSTWVRTVSPHASALLKEATALYDTFQARRVRGSMISPTFISSFP